MTMLIVCNQQLSYLLQATVDDPHNEDNYLILADWLEEYDDPRRAELLRLHRRLIHTCYTPDQYSERVGWHARILELIDQGVQPCVAQRHITLSDGIYMVFSFIPPGSFLMGSPISERGRHTDEKQHGAVIKDGFWMGIHQVTQCQWQTIMGNNPSNFKGDYHPVENVSWYDCVEFCYRIQVNNGIKTRLPTEDEWEYACRAGTTTPYWYGETISNHQANCIPYESRQKGEHINATTPVASFSPNAWGIYDMHGNVWEWCRDQFLKYTDMMLRGGSFTNQAVFVRSTNRNRIVPSIRSYDVGFRIVIDT